MEKVPPEIWIKIWTHACLDNGYTGRSLSLVSRFVRDTSEPVRLQSISLRGHDQILAFASLLKRTPPYLRHVRYLFITSHEASISREPRLAKRRRSGLRWSTTTPTYDVDTLYMNLARAVQSILTDVAETVEILETMLFHRIISSFSTSWPISFPHLREFTTNDVLPLDHPTVFNPCHQLRRLHVSQCFISDLFGRIGTIAPSVTHLRFSGVQQEACFGRDLEVALGIRAEPSQQPWKFKPPARLPSSVQKVLVKPAPPPPSGGWCGTPSASYGSLMMELHCLNEREDRFVLLKAEDGSSPPGRDDCEWLDRVAGGEGCWNLDDKVPRTGFVPKELGIGTYMVGSGMWENY
jgi:hypothetical protein